MAEQREKLPAPDSAQEDSEEPFAAIPEEAEVIEIVDDAAAPEPFTPKVGQERVEADFPPEAQDQLRTLRGQLERKDKQIEQVMEAYRATKAESEKLRERISKTEKRRFEQSKGDFIARFVEVLDNLDRAIDSIEQSFDADSVLQGIMLVRSRLVQLLKTEGLEKIFVRGQTFDPTHSEAAEMETVGDELQDGVVVKELQPGYMLKGSLLRAARVVVGQFDAEDAQPPSGAADPAHESDGAFVIDADDTMAKALEDDPDQTIVHREPDAEEPRAKDGGEAESSPSASRDGEAETDGRRDQDAEDAEDAEESGESWEADESGHELEFSEDGFDFSQKDS